MGLTFSHVSIAQIKFSTVLGSKQGITQAGHKLQLKWPTHAYSSTQLCVVSFFIFTQGWHRQQGTHFNKHLLPPSPLIILCCWSKYTTPTYTTVQMGQVLPVWLWIRSDFVSTRSVSDRQNMQEVSSNTKAHHSFSHSTHLSWPV